jgi:hypothetical protein
VDAAFMCKGRLPYIGLVFVWTDCDVIEELDNSLSILILSGGMVSYPSFMLRLGMMEQMLAFPHRSPMPLMVPWIWSTPAWTAQTVLATARSLSLWQWIPRGC